MITSDIITEKVAINGSIDYDKLTKLWSRVRYYMSRKPASVDFSKTNTQFFKGHAIYPAPLADEKIMPRAMVNDLQVMERSFGIKFLNFDSTSDEDSIKLSPWVWLEDSEADEYEAIIRGKIDDDGEDNVGKKKDIDKLIDFDDGIKPKKPNSKTTK